MQKLHALMGRVLYRLMLPLLYIFGGLSSKGRVRALIVMDEEILLVRNWISEQEWTLPGGGFKGTESGEETVCRELHEELDLTIKTADVISLASFMHTSTKAPFKVHCYIVTKSSKVIKPNHELIEAAWFHLNDLPVGHSQVVVEACAQYRQRN